MVANFEMSSYLCGQFLEAVLTVSHASVAIFIIEHISIKRDVGENGEYLS
jgi:hypothetical protein